MKTSKLLNSLKLAVAVAIAVAIPSPASASILATNSFENNTLGNLSGQAGGSGWTGNWTAPGANTGARVVDTSANPLIFFPANGLPVDGATRALQVTSNNASGQIAGARQLGTPLTQTFYVGYLVQSELRFGGHATRMLRDRSDQMN